LRLPNASTGCSSIAFGATPSWPLSASKKPTPVTVAVPESAVKRPGVRLGAPHSLITRRRA
jgi:hypothetical protein